MYQKNIFGAAKSAENKRPLDLLIICMLTLSDLFLFSLMNI